MGVYIKGMEMPKVAGRMEAVITILKDGTAQIAISPADDGIGYWKEYPLIFVPPHGRLIDADAVLNAIKKAGEDDSEIADVYKEDYAAVSDWLYTAPTIIPADKDGET